MNSSSSSLIITQKNIDPRLNTQQSQQSQSKYQSTFLQQDISRYTLKKELREGIESFDLQQFVESKNNQGLLRRQLKEKGGIEREREKEGEKEGEKQYYYKEERKRKKGEKYKSDYYNSQDQGDIMALHFPVINAPTYQQNDQNKPGGKSYCNNQDAKGEDSYDIDDEEQAREAQEYQYEDVVVDDKKIPQGSNSYNNVYEQHHEQKHEQRGDKLLNEKQPPHYSSKQFKYLQKQNVLLKQKIRLLQTQQKKITEENKEKIRQLKAQLAKQRQSAAQQISKQKDTIKKMLKQKEERNLQEIQRNQTNQHNYSNILSSTSSVFTTSNLSEMFCPELLSPEQTVELLAKLLKKVAKSNKMIKGLFQQQKRALAVHPSPSNRIKDILVKILSSTVQQQLSSLQNQRTNKLKKHTSFSLNGKKQSNNNNDLNGLPSVNAILTEQGKIFKKNKSRTIYFNQYQEEQQDDVQNQQRIQQKQNTIVSITDKQNMNILANGGGIALKKNKRIKEITY